MELRALDVDNRAADPRGRLRLQETLSLFNNDISTESEIGKYLLLVSELKFYSTTSGSFFFDLTTLLALYPLDLGAAEGAGVGCSLD